jgi:hypothetical protein
MRDLESRVLMHLLGVDRCGLEFCLGQLQLGRGGSLCLQCCGSDYIKGVHERALEHVCARVVHRRGATGPGVRSATRGSTAAAKSKIRHPLMDGLNSMVSDNRHNAINSMTVLATSTHSRACQRNHHKALTPEEAAGAAALAAFLGA